MINNNGLNLNKVSIHVLYIEIISNYLKSNVGFEEVGKPEYPER